MTTAAHFLYRHQSRRGAQSVAMAAGCRKTMVRAAVLAWRSTVASYSQALYEQRAGRSWGMSHRTQSRCKCRSPFGSPSPLHLTSACNALPAADLIWTLPYPTGDIVDAGRQRLMIQRVRAAKDQETGMLEYSTVLMRSGRDRACGCRGHQMMWEVRFPVRSEPELRVMRDTDSGRCAWRSRTGLLSCQPAEAGGADRVDQLKLHPVVVSGCIIGCGVDGSDKLGYVAAGAPYEVCAFVDLLRMENELAPGTLERCTGNGQRGTLLMGRSDRSLRSSGSIGCGKGAGGFAESEKNWLTTRNTGTSSPSRTRCRGCTSTPAALLYDLLADPDGGPVQIRGGPAESCPMTLLEGAGKVRIPDRDWDFAGGDLPDLVLCNGEERPVRIIEVVVTGRPGMRHHINLPLADRSRQEAGLFDFRGTGERRQGVARRADRKTEWKRAAIYARVSDKRQADEDKTSISEQIAEMEAHCERRGLSNVARYQEVGRGWTKNRPGFQRMLADAALGRFDTIVCWKSDRLSRGV